MDQVLCVLKNGLASLLDVPGFNYRVHLYQQAYDTLSHKIVLGSETASTISSRGVYKFPVQKTWRVRYDDLQCSSYDLEYCNWSNLPDIDFAMAEDKDWDIGQFVWTGFDYLGEPTPYNLMPNHSSNFGIIDLASIPKDRYWLYRSVWRPDVETLHVLPHWTWPGREGQVTPVHVYTSGDEAELFLNGKSLGRKAKEGYRIVWPDVLYAPGKLEVVCYKDGQEWARDAVQTAGKAAKLSASIDYAGEDLSYITVDVLDKSDVLCPASSAQIEFQVKGPAVIVATDAGDPTSHVPFYSTALPAFNGKASVIVKRTGKGAVTVSAKSKGLKKASVTI
jgi:beta-galactosidase